MNRNKEAYIKQQYLPGYRAEYDFHEIKVLIKGKVVKLYQATITLPYSNYIFAKHYLNQKFESFIDSLVTFFEEIGGVPENIVFDNMRNVLCIGYILKNNCGSVFLYSNCLFNFFNSL